MAGCVGHRRQRPHRRSAARSAARAGRSSATSTIVDDVHISAATLVMPLHR
jgi:hypothetical protein